MLWPVLGPLGPRKGCWMQPTHGLLGRSTASTVVLRFWDLQNACVGGWVPLPTQGFALTLTLTLTLIHYFFRSLSFSFFLSLSLSLSVSLSFSLSLSPSLFSLMFKVFQRSQMIEVFQVGSPAGRRRCATCLTLFGVLDIGLFRPSRPCRWHISHVAEVPPHSYSYSEE